jgi:3-phenylpropionate/cinnamic acid dioxygenase small subunit
LQSSPNIIRIIKPKRMTLAERVARISEERIFMENSDGKRQLGRPRGGWEDNIKLILEKEDEVVLTECIWLVIRTSEELL